MMKAVTVLVLVGWLSCLSSAVEIPPEMKEMLESLQKTCEEESGVDVAVVDAAKKFDFQPDPKFKCFLKCMMTNLQCLTEDGVFDRDTVVGNIPDEFKEMGAVEVVDKCKDTKGADPCDMAFNLVVCFSKYAGEVAEAFV